MKKYQSKEIKPKKYSVVLEISMRVCLQIEAADEQDAKKKAEYSALPLVSSRDFKVTQIKNIQKDDYLEPKKLLPKK